MARTFCSIHALHAHARGDCLFAISLCSSTPQTVLFFQPIQRWHNIRAKSLVFSILRFNGSTSCSFALCKLLSSLSHGKLCARRSWSKFTQSRCSFRYSFYATTHALIARGGRLRSSRFNAKPFSSPPCPSAAGFRLSLCVSFLLSRHSRSYFFCPSRDVFRVRALAVSFLLIAAQPVYLCYSGLLTCFFSHEHGTLPCLSSSRNLVFFRCLPLALSRLGASVLFCWMCLMILIFLEIFPFKTIPAILKSFS